MGNWARLIPTAHANFDNPLAVASPHGEARRIAHPRRFVRGTL
jgi:hypothetical protein